MRRASTILLLCACASILFAQELMPRVRDLLASGQPDQALGALEEAQQKGQRLSVEERFLMARLQTDGDRFDRLTAELGGGQGTEDGLGQEIAFERAREQFARGQYLSALEILRALPASAESRFDDLPIFRAMAAQAVGEQRAARQELEAIPRRHPRHAMAQLLLADLLLRSREAKGALDAAEAAHDADADLLGAQALFLQAQALEQLGQPDDARELKREILREYPRSAEAAGLRGNVAAAAPPTQSSIVEVPSPERRDDFALQLGAFRDRALALRHAERLRDRVEELRIEYDLDSSPAWYRVVVGNYPTRASAERVQQQLKQDRLDAVILVPGRGAP